MIFRRLSRLLVKLRLLSQRRTDRAYETTAPSYETDEDDLYRETRPSKSNPADAPKDSTYFLARSAASAVRDQRNNDRYVRPLALLGSLATGAASVLVPLNFPTDNIYRDISLIVLDIALIASPPLVYVAILRIFTKRRRVWREKQLMALKDDARMLAEYHLREMQHYETWT